MAPNSQPLVIHPAGSDSDFAEGTSHVPLITSVRPMLKSDRARAVFKSVHGNVLEIEFENWSPATVDELVSMLFPQVKEPWSWTPWLILFSSPASKAS